MQIKTWIKNGSGNWHALKRADDNSLLIIMVNMYYVADSVAMSMWKKLSTDFIYSFCMHPASEFEKVKE